MTICLLEKCLIKAKNTGFMPSSDESKAIIDTILEKIDNAKDVNRYDETIEDLRGEDVTAIENLKSMGYSEEIIERAIKKGLKVESILDVEKEISPKL